MQKPGYFDNLRPEMMQFVPPEAQKILEVGCGSGHFGASLKQQRSGAVVWGVEPDEEICKAARQRLDKVLNCHFDNRAELPLSNFDCIVLNDVLEHLIYPEEALRYCRKLLKPRGVVVASVPNVRYIKNVVEFLFRADWRYKDDGVLDQTHLRFFTRKSLIRLITEAGGEIITLAGINPTRSRFFPLLNVLMLNRIADMRYLQHAVVFRFK